VFFSKFLGSPPFFQNQDQEIEHFFSHACYAINPIAMNSIPKTTMDGLLEQYEVLLFDAYGVLVHFSGAMPGAVKLIRHLNQSRKSYYILTNDASKLPATAASRYQGYGLDIDAAHILTSGGLIKNYFKMHGLAGARCVVLGPTDSNSYVARAGGKIVSAKHDFDVIVIADESGYPFLETVDQVFTALCRQLDRGQHVHMLLPNPDLIYPKADQGIGFTAGSIAGIYEAALKLRYPNRRDLRFKRLGKPEIDLFAAAYAHSRTRDMVMIGDQLETDIRGARRFGIDAAWIQTGIMPGTPSQIPDAVQPTYILDSLLKE
jgi:HAD superfamily hydrolase (TIGR01450 family)